MARLAVDPTELVNTTEAPAIVPPSAVNGTVRTKAPPFRIESSPWK